jgi:hypothetical protein
MQLRYEIYVTPQSAKVIERMSLLRALPAERIVAEIVNSELESAVVVEFPSHVPGARRSRGR